MRPPGPARRVRAEFDPLDEAGQVVAKLLDRRVVGFAERLYGLRVAFLAFWSASPADKDPDGCLSRFDLWVVAAAKEDLSFSSMRAVPVCFMSSSQSFSSLLSYSCKKTNTYY